jgi:heptosyltransferase I
MNTLPLSSPPESLCLLRLSAIGDISHALPVVRTLQSHWPSTRLSWGIGATEHALVGDIPGVEFIIFDKARRLNAVADLRRQLAGRRFDVLLHMQMSLRASLASLAIRAPIKLGFDRPRAKDLQWAFTNHRIAHHPAEHVLDSFFGFTAALGLAARELRWEIPIPDYAREFAAANLPGDTPTLLISPCSAHAYRNWHAEGYAAVADHAAGCHGMRVVLTGGLSAIETKFGRDIEALARHRPLNLIGRTDLKQLLALLERGTALLAPDSGPAHLATAVGTPVIGLYAATDPARARPYLSGDWVVSRYAEAAHDRFGTPLDAPPFGRRIREPGTMDRITPREVAASLDRLLARV